MSGDTTTPTVQSLQFFTEPARISPGEYSAAEASLSSPEGGTPFSLPGSIPRNYGQTLTDDVPTDLLEVKGDRIGLTTIGPNGKEIDHVEDLVGPTLAR